MASGQKLFQQQSLPDCSKDVTKDNSVVESAENGLNDLLWFNTWPERCDKQKIETNVDNVKQTNNTHKEIIQQQLTLNEALQNISLAYSPITKQLHLIENKPVNSTSGDENFCKIDTLKTGSSIQHPHFNCSNVEPPEIASEDNNSRSRKRSLAHFFTK